MILVRLVFQAKFGKANDLAAAFKQGQEQIQQVVGPNVRGRILTDLSGPFDTVVQEVEVESLAVWEQSRATLFSNPQFQQEQARTSDLIESGRTEFYTIE